MLKIAINIFKYSETLNTVLRSQLLSFKTQFKYMTHWKILFSTVETILILSKNVKKKKVYT